jgi:hypothetical protein
MPALALLSAGLAATGLGLPPFTTAPKADAATGVQAELTSVGVACHRGFDRFVVRGRLATPGYKVRYARRIVQDGSGDPVPLLGRKRIRVVLRRARAHTEAGDPTLPRTVTPLCPNLRQVKEAGDFEGVVTFGLGLRSRAGFRVFRLSAPTRVVIDVKH